MDSSLFDLRASSSRKRAREIIVDSFAGGGGASTGICLALGRHPDVAVNHDPEAVAMHTANHPATEHFCQNVWQVDPSEVAARGPIGLAWFSPDCKHFSKAKGGKPVEKRIRDLAWVVVAWARLPAHLRPRVIILENVEEFTTWGPLADNGRPCPIRKGEEFRRWTGELKRLGYRLDWRELRACDFGAPTIRKRLFLIARCDDQPIIWPEPTHGAPNSPEVLAGLRKPWRTAAEIIDWSIPCPSIFLTKEEARAIGVKRPLEEATMRRIFRGLDRYVLRHPRPFIVPVTHAGDDRCHDSAEPLRTITTAKRGELSVVMPYLAGCGGRAGQSPERSPGSPMGTITAKADQILVTPHLTRFHTKSVGSEADAPMPTVETHLTDGLVTPFITKFRNGSIGHEAGEPLHTITTAHSEHHPGGAAPLGLVRPYMVRVDHTSAAARNGVHDSDEPLRTVTSAGGIAVVAPTMLVNTSGHPGGRADDPLHTVTTGGHHAVIAPHLETMRNADKPFNDADSPTHTITAGGAGLNVVSAWMVQHNNDVKREGGVHPGRPAGEPMSTITASGSQQMVAAAHLTQFHGSNQGNGGDPEQPLGAVLAQGFHHAEVRAFLVKYYGEGGQDQDCRDPLHTIPTKARFGLVTVEGEDYAVVDIGMRMLSPRELFRAQGFPDSYIIDLEINGRPLPKSSQVRMCGNSVCPPIAAALVRANVPDLACNKEEIHDAAE
jgi:DNA (cytosine-5)-methyltransferase 1